MCFDGGVNGLKDGGRIVGRLQQLSDRQSGRWCEVQCTQLERAKHSSSEASEVLRASERCM